MKPLSPICGGGWKLRRFVRTVIVSSAAAALLAMPTLGKADGPQQSAANPAKPSQNVNAQKTATGKDVNKLSDPKTSSAPNTRPRLVPKQQAEYGVASRNEASEKPGAAKTHMPRKRKRTGIVPIQPHTSHCN